MFLLWPYLGSQHGTGSKIRQGSLLRTSAPYRHAGEGTHRCSVRQSQALLFPFRVMPEQNSRKRT